MRRVLVWVPEGAGAKVRELAREHGSTDTLALTAEGDDGPVDLFVLQVPNRRVGDLVGQLSAVDGLHVSMFPQGVLALKPPASEAAEQVTDITLRSPLEIFLGGLQSVGSWRGFLSYATVSGLIVWVGLFTNTVYLLTAAMLIAPFAGPAMNAAVATARGDLHLLRRSIGRYLASLAVAIAVTGLMSLLLRQRIATEQMVQTTSISTVAVVLPLVAGVAGAVNLAQSERSSLVSGAATGMLVAASLAPPAGTVGMATALGEWAMVRSGLFLLGLQLVGINLAGALTFRLVGLGPEGGRYHRGRGWVQKVSLAATVLALAGLLFWQFSSSPELQRSTQAQRAAALMQEVVNSSGQARLVEANARFTRADIPGQNTLLAVVYAQRATGVDGSAAEVERQLTQRIQRALLRQFPNVTPVVQVNLLATP